MQYIDFYVVYMFKCIYINNLYKYYKDINIFKNIKM